ncbi:YlxR family protein [Leucobacter chinensis]|uniref:YlxR family protein n=1 Tax=Leucobacter chinensis TaxID=2851010 RepID=UPI0035102D47
MEAIRSCVGCGVRASRGSLLRVVERNGRVVIDEGACLPGRGAWLHRSRACIERAMTRGGFPRALRVSVKLDTAELENRLETMMDNS